MIHVSDLPEGTEVDKWYPLMETESAVKKLQQKMKKQRKTKRREKERERGGEGSSIEIMEDTELGKTLGELHLKLLYRKGPQVSDRAHETV